MPLVIISHACRPELPGERRPSTSLGHQYISFPTVVFGMQIDPPAKRAKAVFVLAFVHVEDSARWTQDSSAANTVRPAQHCGKIKCLLSPALSSAAEEREKEPSQPLH